ncbi:hypothetical protein A2U01_0070904, partial [Trifolium medium]|nr:hypothetical protein [Trifolium medium]
IRRSKVTPSLARGAKASALGAGSAQILGLTTGLGMGRITLGAARVHDASPWPRHWRPRDRLGVRL